MIARLPSRLSALLLLTAPMTSIAAPSLNDVRALAGEGWDVAQYQIALHGGGEGSAAALVQGNWISLDLNGDGIDDVVAIFERNPRWTNERSQPCEAGSDGCSPEFGDRELRAYLGRREGGFRLAASNSTVVRADEGGGFGDPLSGLEKSDGPTVAIGFYGGSRERYSGWFGFQWRDGGLRLTREIRGTIDSVTGQSRVVHVDYLGLRRLVSETDSFESQERGEWEPIPSVPLTPLGQANLRPW